MKNVIVVSEAKAQSRRMFTLGIAIMPAVMVGFLVGYCGAIILEAVPFITDQFHLTPRMLGFVMTSTVIGCPFGALLGGWLCDKIGREKTLIVCASLFGLGALMTALATDVTIPGGQTISTLTVLNTFRMISGFAIGLGSVASLLYIVEIAPPRIRGKLCLMYQFALVIGSATAPVVGYLLSLYLPAETAWRWMFALQLVIVAILFLFLFVQIPSPRWLAEKGRFTEALDTLKKVRETSVAEREFVEIKASLNEEQGGWREILHPSVRFSLLIGCLFALFNNWTGWSALGNSIIPLLELAGVKSHSVAIIQFSFTYVAMAIVTVISLLLVDRVGRRPLWIFASILMALITFVAGEVFFLHLHGLIVLVVLCICTVPHGIALGGLPWLMMSELYPTRVRAKAVALTTAFLWIIIYSCVYLFPIFSKMSANGLGSSVGVFWFFAFICILSTIFGLTIMPETKGRTLEEIASSLNKE